jgi:thioredoxin-related protein
VSAFAPPETYSFKYLSDQKNLDKLPEHAVYGPHNIVSFDDYDKGLAYARLVKKPILIDFTGKQCQNCRLMEANVWSDKEILKIMKNDIVLVSLYCDDKKELPVNEQFTSKLSGAEITTIGEKWNEFEVQKFNNNSRPYYVLLDLNEKKLNEPVSYTPNIAEYKNWLLNGISKFK